MCISVQTAGQPLDAKQAVILAFELFQIITRVCLGNKDARVISHTEEEWFGYAGSNDSRFSSSLFIEHGKNLS